MSKFSIYESVYKALDEFYEGAIKIVAAMEKEEFDALPAKASV